MRCSTFCTLSPPFPIELVQYILCEEGSQVAYNQGSVKVRLGIAKLAILLLPVAATWLFSRSVLVLRGRAWRPICDFDGALPRTQKP